MPNSVVNWSPSPSRTCASSWRPILVTAGAADTRGRIPASMPRWCASRSVRTRSATACPTSRSSRAAEPPRSAGPADVDRPAHHLPGEDDMRPAFRGSILAVIVRAADIDLDVVDGGAGAVGQPKVHAAELHVELDDHNRPGEPGAREVQVDRTHPPVQGQPRRNDPLPLTLE